MDWLAPPGIAWLLMAIGVVMLLLEAMVPGFFLAVPATILILLGVVALIVPDFSLFTVWAPILALAIGIPATLVTVWTYRRMAMPDRAPTTETAENLVGQEGTVVVDVLPEATKGKVRIKHQMWSATVQGAPIPKHAKVRVERVEGVILVVRAI